MENLYSEIGNVIWSKIYNNANDNIGTNVHPVSWNKLSNTMLGIHDGVIDNVYVPIENNSRNK